MSVTKKLSLFDVFMENIFDDLRQYPEIRSEEMDANFLDGTGRETRDFHPRNLAISSLRSGLSKRYIGATSKTAPSLKDRNRIAINEFLEDNDRCLDYNRHFSPSSMSVFTQSVLGEVQMLLSKVLDHPSGSCLHMQAVSQNMRSGPGLSSDIPGTASTYAKQCDGAMSFTSTAVAATYKACMSSTRLSFTTEAVRKSLYGELDLFNSQAHFLSVPKTNLKDRGICTQPSGNMTLQLSTHEILSEQLRLSFGCDLSTQQEKNRKLAYLGSKGQKSWLTNSWNFCTLDLSRASNFPWVIIQFLFPKLWVEWLRLIRSPTMLVEETSVKKHMCSTMGNGFTFSLMTILLSAIIKVIYRAGNLPEYDVHPQLGKLKTWAVYGDDIIVDKQVFNAVLIVLKDLGFLVNKSKTFSTGFFRESCGADFYDGYPVRPVFVETLQTQADIYSLLNRLVIWGVTHSIPLPKALKTLRQAIGQDELRVPNWEDVSHGLHVPFVMANHNPVGVPPFIRNMLNSGNVPYECITTVPNRIPLYREKEVKVLYSDIASRNVYTYRMTVSTKEYFTEFPGVLYVLLEGSLRRGQFGVRPLGDAEYQNVWKIAPSWGDPLLFSDTAICLRTGVTLSIYRLWEEYVKQNVRR